MGYSEYDAALFTSEADGDPPISRYVQSLTVRREPRFRPAPGRRTVLGLADYGVPP